MAAAAASALPTARVKRKSSDVGAVETATTALPFVTFDSSLCVDAHDEDLICCICHQIPLLPVESSCCGHICCRSCVDLLVTNASATQTEPKCPSCRTVLPRQQMQMSAFASKKISGLRVKCPMHAQGCAVVVLVGLQGATLAKHVRDCDFGVQICSACNETHTKREAATHMAQTCKSRQVTCNYCHSVMKLAAYKEHLQAVTHPLLGCIHRQFCPFGCKHRLPTTSSSSSSSSSAASASASAPAPTATSAAANAATTIRSNSAPSSQSQPAADSASSGSAAVDLHSNAPDESTASNKRIKLDEKSAASVDATSFTAAANAGSSSSSSSSSAAAAAAAAGALSPGRIVFLSASPALPNGSSAVAVAVAAAPASGGAAFVPLTPPIPLLPTAAASTTAALPASSSSAASTAFTLLVSPSVVVPSVTLNEPDMPPPSERTIILRSQLSKHREVCPRFPIRCQFCEAVEPREEMSAHCEENVSEHLTSVKHQLDQTRALFSDMVKRERESLHRLMHYIEFSPAGFVTGLRAAHRMRSAAAPLPYPSNAGKLEFESKDCLMPSGHSFALYVLVENDKVGLFLKYKAGPLPVNLDFTVAVRHWDGDDDRGTQHRIRGSSGSGANGTGGSPAHSRSAAAAVSTAAASAATGSEASSDGFRMFAKRSTRYVITDPNRSVVGFSQVTTLSECASAGLLSDDEDDDSSFVVGAIFRVVPQPPPAWLQTSRHAN